MRLQELFETTEEDRALISLSSAIYNMLTEYVGTDDTGLIRLGKIGDILDTPVDALQHVSIDLLSGPEFTKRAEADPDSIANGTSQVFAVWEATTDTIILNTEYLDSPRMKTAITHELRHALDEVKSGSFPASKKNKDPENINRYFTPKKKEHRKADPYNNTQYRAQPAEINARFVELLDILSKRIPKWYAKLDASEIKSQLTTDFKNLLVKFEIAELFPEKTKSSDYKRLVKRAYDFMQKEIAHVEADLAKKGTPKNASGQW
jgi:hypothetical protein